MAIDFDLDCDRVTEALKKRKKKKSSKVHLSGKASGEGSARTRETEDPSAAAGTVAAFANHDGAEPSHLHMPVTPTPGVTVDHDGFHLSSMTSSLRQTLVAWVMILIILQLALMCVTNSTSPCLG